MYIHTLTNHGLWDKWRGCSGSNVRPRKGMALFWPGVTRVSIDDAIVGENIEERARRMISDLVRTHKDFFSKSY